MAPRIREYGGWLFVYNSTRWKEHILCGFERVGRGSSIVYLMTYSLRSLSDLDEGCVWYGALGSLWVKNTGGIRGG